MDRKAVLMSVESRVRKFRGIHRSWKLLHHNRMGGVNTDAAWVGIVAAFGNPYIEVILSLGVPRALTKIWENI